MKNIITIVLVYVILMLCIFFISSPRDFIQDVFSSSTVSPLICGANIDGPIANSPASAKQLNVQTIRLAATDSSFASRLQMIHDNGFVPLVVMRGCGVTDPQQRLNANIAIVNQVQGIFGGPNAQVYYELGNENDLQCGLSSTGYTAMWNAIIPSLRQIAPNSWFGGPVNFQRNPPYVADFIHNANPKPNFISWHEYTCSSSSPNSSCIQSIANWTTHVTDTKNAITANGDAVPPIMITEWNYAPDSGVTGDNKHNDPAFMTQWTTTALQTLIANNIYASYHFNVSNATPLIGSPQGQTFQNICQQLIAGGGSITPSPTLPSPSQPPALSPTVTLAITVTPSPSSTPIPSTIPTVSPTSPQPTVPIKSGNSVCSSGRNHACSYTDNCRENKEGDICEFGVNGCDKDSSGNNVYICRRGKWVYDHWTQHGQCRVCSTGKNKSGRENQPQQCHKGIGGGVMDLLQLYKNDCQSKPEKPKATYDRYSNPLQTAIQNIQDFFAGIFSSNN